VEQRAALIQSPESLSHHLAAQLWWQNKSLSKSFNSWHYSLSISITFKRQWGEFCAATSGESSTIYCLQLSAKFPIELEAFYSFITPQGNRHGCTPTLVQPIAFFWIISMYFHKHHIAWP
jgi:hypothetical protein